MPDPPVERYGCSVDVRDNSVKVNVRDLKRPPREWITTVWAVITGQAKRWESELAEHRTERARALKDCDQWMGAVEKKLRGK